MRDIIDSSSPLRKPLAENNKEIKVFDSNMVAKKSEENLLMNSRPKLTIEGTEMKTKHRYEDFGFQLVKQVKFDEMNALSSKMDKELKPADLEVA